MSVRSKSNREGEAPAEMEREGSQLPEGWGISTVRECFLDVRNGTTATQNKNGAGIPVSRIETIQNRRFDMSRVQHLEDASDDFIENFRYRPGDIAFSHINSYEHVGKTALYEGEPDIFIHGMNLLRLRLGHEFIEPRFAHFFMQTDYFREEVRQRVGHAVNQVSINQKNLAEVPFMIAPLAEQRRIVGKLELVLGKVSSSRQRLSRVPGLLKRFRQSVLAAACSGKLTADWREENGVAMEDWNESKLLDLLAEPLANGRSVRDAIDGFPVLRLTCLKNGRIDLAERKIGEWTKKDAQRFLVKKDDYLVSRGNGSHSLVGRGGLVVDEPDDVAYPDTLIRMRLQQAIMSPEFVSSIWNSPQIRSQIEAAAHTSAGIWKISQADIEGFVIPVPPLSEQQGIVRRVEKLFTFADQIEARLRQAQSHVDRLTQSVLAKAFRGELVPTEAKLARHENRSYDPASELLARIQADREQSGELSKVSTKRARAATRK